MKCHVIALLLSFCADSFAQEVLWAVDRNPNDPRILAYDLDDGNLVRDFPSPGGASGVAQFGDRLLILDESTGSSSFFVTDLNGDLISSFDLGQPVESFDVMDNGDLLIEENGVISIIDRSGLVKESFTATSDGSTMYDCFGQMGDPRGVATNGVDEIYAIDFCGVIRTYDLEGSLTSTIEPWSEFRIAFFGLAATENDFYVSDLDYVAVFRVSSSGDAEQFLDLPQDPGGGMYSLDIGTIPVPEPASIGLAMLGAILTALWRDMNCG